ncbi:MAG: hypothetical protein GY827_01410 [Cytophagales bacterium]|nr:hypothetical protein [Cytophagales bacterium]
MKCSKCGYNHKKKYGFKCSNCGHNFTFDPSNGISDFLFKKVITKTSKENTIYFTKRNLFSTYKGILINKGKSRQKIYLIFFIISFIILICNVFPFVFILISTIICLGKLIQYTFFNKGVSYKQFYECIRTWPKNNPQDLKLMINDKVRLNTISQSQAPEKDVYNYGLEGIVLVDEEQYVDWLIMNNFHFTNRVAIISTSGYPQNLVSIVQDLVKENNRLPIYFLHNGNISVNEMLNNTSFLNVENQKYRIDIGISKDLFDKVPALKNKKEVVPFDSIYPLDTLAYSQIANLFGQFKNNIDERRRQLDDNDTEMDMIIMDSGMMDMGTFGSTEGIDMDLDFG